MPGHNLHVGAEVGIEAIPDVMVDYGSGQGQAAANVPYHMDNNNITNLRPYSGPTATIRHYQPLDPYEKRNLRQQSVEYAIKFASIPDFDWAGDYSVTGLAKDIYRYITTGRAIRPNAN